MTWQTDLRVYSGYPWRCKHAKLEDTTDLGDMGDLGSDEVAFWCDLKPYRILTCECLADECPFCELIQIEEYEHFIKGGI